VFKVMHESDLTTCLSCSITTKGGSYRSYILKWWPRIIGEKFFDQLIRHTEDGGLNVPCGGKIGLQGR